ncbi:universal stress protein [Mycobacterium uberis]|uniref:Universal stress protein n=1 Tax=Mycobacterium uberis TaxID=2162698 RepID=A0A3E1HKE2_9MYCO|nr:universal stress protein [Mycobacterium uberis]RFD26735.1 universal stress protein [Mycobacterium uberis]
MRDVQSDPSIIVGVDGSRAANNATVWAVDEAVSRNIPLRLVYVIDTADLCGADVDHRQFAAAHAALYDAQRAVQATGEPVKIEVEIMSGTPLRELIGKSRSAVMTCVGSIGMKHACRGISSVAVGLTAWARCPVAVIRTQLRWPTNHQLGSIVAEADHSLVLRHAFEEARLRVAPLRVVASWRAETPDDLPDGSRLVQAHLNRRISPWRKLYPDVDVEPVAVRGSICRYLTENAESVQLFVSGSGGHACELQADSDGCSVLTVRQSH